MQSSSLSHFEFITYSPDGTDRPVILIFYLFPETLDVYVWSRSCSLVNT